VTDSDDAIRMAPLLDKVFAAARPGLAFSAPVVAGAYTIITASEVMTGGGFGLGGSDTPSADNGIMVATAEVAEAGQARDPSPQSSSDLMGSRLNRSSMSPRSRSQVSLLGAPWASCWRVWSGAAGNELHGDAQHKAPDWADVPTYGPRRPSYVGQHTRGDRVERDNFRGSGWPVDRGRAGATAGWKSG
jgi:hypothetical protein